MSFWEYANPVKFLKLSGTVLPYFSILAAITIIAGITWGFLFTPDDYKQGATVKILYVHVPSAFIAINAWFMMLVASIIWLIRRHHVSALAAKAAAPIGIAMTIIGLVTGALLGQPIWGTWWLVIAEVIPAPIAIVKNAALMPLRLGSPKLTLEAPQVVLT